MPKGLNEVRLLGYLGKDPEIKYTPGGIAVATFSVATSKSWKDGDGNKQERTEWHRIVAWRKLAEICSEWLKKGSHVYISGEIQYRNYDDKNSGEKKYTTEIVADDLIMLDSKKTTAEPSGAPAAESEHSKDDDLPF